MASQSGIEGFAVTKYLTNLSKMIPFLLSVLSRIRNGMKTMLGDRGTMEVSKDELKAG